MTKRLSENPRAVELVAERLAAAGSRKWRGLNSSHRGALRGQAAVLLTAIEPFTREEPDGPRYSITRCREHKAELEVQRDGPATCSGCQGPPPVEWIEHVLVVALADPQEEPCATCGGCRLVRPPAPADAYRQRRPDCTRPQAEIGKCDGAGTVRHEGHAVYNCPGCIRCGRPSDSEAKAAEYRRQEQDDVEILAAVRAWLTKTGRTTR
jgi:hypothetical protein